MGNSRLQTVVKSMQLKFVFQLRIHKMLQERNKKILLTSTLLKILLFLHERNETLSV